MDGGAWEVKAGFAGDDNPKAVFRNIIGCTRKDDINNGTIGRRMNGLYTIHPMEHGCITNWSAMERIWRHTFSNQLNIRSEECSILFADNGPFSSSTTTTRQHRQKIATIMFETFNVPELYFKNTAPLSLYATGGRTTGVVLDSGEEATHVVAVYEGFNLPHTTTMLEIGGAALTEQLSRLLAERGYSFRTAADMEVVCSIKEKLGYVVATDFNQEMKRAESSSSVDRTYEMPDGQVITVGSERFRFTEAFFQPCMVGRGTGKVGLGSGNGIHEQIVSCVMKGDADIRKDLYLNVVLSGGSTMFEGLTARVQKELTAVAPNVLKALVTAPHERKWSAWIGGSIMGALTTFQGMCVTKAEYDESGPVVIDRKCF